ncbi:uncharacterized protein LOC124893711, partial [Capsicum annuum]|uniref:uncharacterized protein LOC124893711 n=1 Tax=Capsicum annuum TaxID=4072 RepID=UPI001FB0B93C
MRRVTMLWDEFVEVIINRFFPLELRKAKVEDFMNLKQDDLVLECQGAMLNRDIDFARLSVHMQKVEEKKKKIAKSRENNSQTISRETAQLQGIMLEEPSLWANSSAPPPPEKGSFSDASPRGHRKCSGQPGRKSTPTGRLKDITYDWVVALRKNRGEDDAPVTCCGKIGHRLSECPYARQGSRDNRSQAQATSTPTSAARPVPPQGASSSTVDGQRQNRFCDLISHQEKKDSPDIITAMLLVFHFDVYVLLKPRSSFSYVTPLVAMNFK